MPHIIITDKKKQSRAYDFTDGDTILTLARRYKLDLEGACDGAMACATCHVVVDADWVAKLAKPSVEELSMLDAAPKVTRTSRLGCQIILSSDLDGLKVTLA